MEPKQQVVLLDDGATLVPNSKQHQVAATKSDNDFWDWDEFFDNVERGLGLGSTFVNEIIIPTSSAGQPPIIVQENTEPAIPQWFLYGGIVAGTFGILYLGIKAFKK